MALEKQQKQMIITGALVLVLAMAGLNSFNQVKKAQKGRGGKKKAAMVKKDATKKAEVSASVNAPVFQKPTIGGFRPPSEEIMQDQLARIDNDLPVKDPFYPIANTVSFRRGSLVLKGISWKEHGPSFVIINENIVQIGESVKGNRVVDIKKNSVVLEKDNQEYILMLEE